MKKGTYVSRAVYTKLQMENKSLLKDLYSIVMTMHPDAILTRIKWKDKFTSEKMFREMMQELLLTKKKGPGDGQPGMERLPGKE